MTPRVLGFFHVMGVVPRSTLTALGVVTAVGCGGIVVNVDLGSRVLVPVLVLQLFAAASGFRVPARRGHYDLLFTSGERRFNIAAGHWVMSVIPGVVAWLVLAATEYVAGGRTLVASGTIVAVTLTSTVPWALTVPWPRSSGAIAWLVVASSVAGMPVIGGGAPSTVLFPWLWVGVELLGRHSLTGLMLAMLGISSVGMAAAWICRLDVPLESGQ
jgi:hypothetical protein